MCLAQRPQRSDASEARTGGPSVSSQALRSLQIVPAHEKMVLIAYALPFVY